MDRNDERRLELLKIKQGAEALRHLCEMSFTLYMNKHNYGKEDSAMYNKDKEYQDLIRAYDSAELWQRRCDTEYFQYKYGG